MRLLILLILLPFITQGQIVRTHPYYKPFAASGCTPDADAQKFIDSTGITDQTQKDAICTLVRELKDSSLWSSMSAIYPFVGGTASTHKWNLKDPQNTDAAFRLTFSGTWTHSSTGADPNGTTAYANTFLNPSSVLTLNSTSMGYYSRDNIAGDYIDMGIAEGTGGNPRMVMHIKWSDNNSYHDQYSYTSGGRITYAMGATSTAGFFVSSRTSSTAFNYFINGNSVASLGTTNTSALPNGNIYLANYKSGNNFYSPREVAFAFIASGLTTTNVRALNTIVEKFNDALGRGVQ